MRVVDLQAVRVLIGEFRFQGGNDQLVIALAGKMNAAILESLNRQLRRFCDREFKSFVLFQVSVIGGRGTLDHLASLHNVARIDVLIDENGADIIVPFEIINQTPAFRFRRVCRFPFRTPTTGGGRHEPRRDVAVLAAFAVEVMS